TQKPAIFRIMANGHRPQKGENCATKDVALAIKLTKPKFQLHKIAQIIRKAESIMSVEELGQRKVTREGWKRGISQTICQFRQFTRECATFFKRGAKKIGHPAKKTYLWRANS
ncbi:MAG: hypothetical protein J6W69_00550, partial [Bacteroidales bacterium]|nr:hypothetical protein [Bacteroidales bacterium]